MREIVVTRKNWQPNNKHQQAKTFIGIDEPIKLIDEQDGKVIAIQALLKNDLIDEQRWLSRWLRFGAKWDDASKVSKKTATSQARLSGIRYPSRVFGYTAPQPLRRRWACSATSLTRDNPDVMKVLESFTAKNWELFSEHAPLEADKHKNLVDEKINDDWKIGKYPWTSGVINNTAALPYHRDKGNIVDSWSAMLALRKNVSGGALHLPEYDVTFGIPNGSITLFDGQGTWHGVTPLVHQTKDAYRFTLVWYTKQGICKCGSALEEEIEAKKRATR